MTSKKIPIPVLKFFVAHELGHVMQSRNWREGDGTKLEEDANRRVKNWCFKKTKPIAKSMKDYAAKFGEKFLSDEVW